jgi:hypothetical protein
VTTASFGTLSGSYTDNPSLSNAINAVSTSGSAHAARTDNPHGVTKAQIGLSSVDNVAASALRDRATHTGTQAITTIAPFTMAQLNAAISDGDVVDVSFGGKGVAALDLVPAHLRGEKFIIMDLIGDGVAERDGATMAFSTVAERSTITRSSAALRGTRKRKIESVAANVLRDHHDFQGVPQGKLYEASAINLFPRSQPTIAQLSTHSNTSDNTAPSGESGNWLSVSTIGVTAYAYLSLTLTAGDIVCMQQEIIMDDGSAPVPQNAPSSAGDFTFVFESTFGARNPDTGSVGYKLTGPLAGNKYIVTAYYTVAATGAAYYGWVKYASQSAKNFKMGRRDIKIGRYPSSMIDATGTPATRAADVHSVALIGYTGDEITMACEFAVPTGDGFQHWVCSLHGNQSQTASGYGFFSLTANGPNPSNVLVAALRGDDIVPWNYAASGVVGVGSKVRAVLRQSKVTGKISLAVNGQALVHSLVDNFPLVTPTTLLLGHWFGSYHLNQSIRVAAVFDHGWSDAEMLEWVDA